MTKNNNGKNLKGKLTLDLPKTIDISKIGDFKVKIKKKLPEKAPNQVKNVEPDSINRGLSKGEIEYRKKALENYEKKNN